MDIVRYLKATCREYLRNNIAAAIYADDVPRNPRPHATSPANPHTTSPQTRTPSDMTGSMANPATTDYSYVANVSGEPCLVTFDADESMLVARPVGNLGLMQW